MEKKLYVGIDVSKGYGDFVIFDEQKQQQESLFQLDDNIQGHEQLKQILGRYVQQGYNKIYCGLESTGGYENLWIQQLINWGEELSVQVARLNARAVKGVNDAELRRTTTDGTSAENIALYLMNHPNKVQYLSYQTANDLKEARTHYNFIKMLVKQKVQLNNQLEKLLYQHYSELLVYCRHGIPGWLLRMLAQYGTATQVVKAGIKGLVKIKGITEAKAQVLIAKSIKSSAANAHTGFVIQQTSKEILHKQQQIEANKSYLTGLFSNSILAKLLTSIPGIGLESAVILLMEIEDIHRFASAKKLASFFGVNPEYKQSGDGIGGHHMSKKGRGTIRGVLYMACMTGIRKNESIKKRYAAARAQGRGHYDAMGIVMHKLLRIVFGVLIHQVAFDQKIDQQNQQKAEEKQKEKKETGKKIQKEALKGKRRYQVETTEDVPLSSRATKKRKKLSES